nr:MAG TPA: hypothetical protein [Caudoviricetes sp.]
MLYADATSHGVRIFYVYSIRLNDCLIEYCIQCTAYN